MDFWYCLVQSTAPTAALSTECHPPLVLLRGEREGGEVGPFSFGFRSLGSFPPHPPLG